LPIFKKNWYNVHLKGGTNMHNPDKILGKSALYFEKGAVSQTTRVTVYDWLGGDMYILKDFEEPDKKYTTRGWNFTIEKEEDQPKAKEA
jgi:hypothetical protein